MKMSLFAGATALALIAGAAWAEDTTITRTVTTTPSVVVPVAGVQTTTVEQTVDPRSGAIIKRTQTGQSAPTIITTTTSQVDPSVFNPARTTTYHEERSIQPGAQTEVKTYTTEAATTPDTKTTTYTRTTTVTSK